jgi:hypothetical protein
MENKPRENKHVWNHSHRFNHSNFSKDYKYPHQRRPFSKSQVPSQSTVKDTPNQGTASNGSNVRPRRFNSYKPRRPYNSRRVPRSKNPPPTVKTKWVKKESTDGGQTVLSAGQEEKGCVDENPTQVLKSKTIILDSAFKNSGDYIFKDFEYVTPQGEHKSVMAWVPKRN